MKYEKIAISLPSRAAERVRRAVRAGKAASVSAYIASAVEEKVKQDSLAAMLQDFLADTGGPMTPSERRWADKMLGIGRRRSKP